MTSADGQSRFTFAAPGDRRSDGKHQVRAARESYTTRRDLNPTHFAITSTTARSVARRVEHDDFAAARGWINTDQAANSHADRSRRLRDCQRVGAVAALLLVCARVIFTSDKTSFRSRERNVTLPHKHRAQRRTTTTDSGKIDRTTLDSDIEWPFRQADKSARVHLHSLHSHAQREIVYQVPRSTRKMTF